jgi:hypothetical protein
MGPDLMEYAAKTMQPGPNGERSVSQDKKAKNNH